MHRAYLGSLLENDYLTNIRNGLEFIQFEKIVKPDTRIFIKPNLTFPIYRPGVMTNPQMVEATIQAIRDYSHHIWIGDSDSGGYNRFSMDEVYNSTGLLDICNKFGAKVVNLSKIPRRAINFRYGRKSFSLQLPVLLLDETDLVVSLPVPKIHCNTGVSLSIKNQWGCIPENQDRLRLHPYFQHVILEVNQAIRARVAIMDGRYGLNVNGPMIGETEELNWLLVADHLGVADRLGCELMQIPLEKIAHLRYAEKQNFIPARTDIETNRETAAFLSKPFYLHRKWTDIPGLLAFNHAFIAYLAYFSPLADILHKLLYLFRKPFYDYKKYSNK